MKYSQQIGIVAVLALAAVCFIPWVYIASVNITITGFNAKGTNFGKPGLAAIVLSAVCVIFFLTPKVWAKRTNVFLSAIVFAWSIKNYLLITACLAGDCPEKKAGIYLQVLFSFVIMIMALLPKISLPEEK
jgi:hypothetical protein